MQKYKNHTLKAYLDSLSAKTPVPGGGSAAALVGSLGTALVSMVANYSLRKTKSRSLNSQIRIALLKSEKIRKRLLDLVDLDAEAYLGVVKSRAQNEKMKKRALKKAREIPLEVCRLCYDAVLLTSLLAQKGNPNLLSDIRVAVEMLTAAFNSAMVNARVNR